MILFLLVPISSAYDMGLALILFLQLMYKEKKSQFQLNFQYFLSKQVKNKLQLQQPKMRQKQMPKILHF